jgi:lipoate-protein ligase A
MLRCIQRSETDPYYNLAAEEYLLKTATVNTFMTWRNEPSVIVGKHQNTSREINHPFIESCNLPVIRRITGGGTVYHDLGNINFSFIYTDRKDNPVDFRYFTEPVIKFIQELGLNASFEGKNNITIDGLKVSGNSAHLYKNKVLHHGTLLFNSDLGALKKALAGRKDHYKDKSVRSIRSKVANICDLLKEEISVEEFIGLFRNFIIKNFNDAYLHELQPKEKEAIQNLAEEKYKSYKWNFGYSPEYYYDDDYETKEGRFSISLSVKDGLIIKAEITGPENYINVLKRLSEILNDAFHEKKSILERLKTLTFANEMEKRILYQIIRHLF